MRHGVDDLASAGMVRDDVLEGLLRVRGVGGQPQRDEPSVGLAHAPCSLYATQASHAGSVTPKLGLGFHFYCDARHARMSVSEDGIDVLRAKPPAPAALEGVDLELRLSAFVFD